MVSAVVNILGLTSPLFMLQVYDRVLASGSIPTLVGISILAAGMFIFQALLDIIRARILLRIGERYDKRLSGRVFKAVVRLPLLSRSEGDGLQPLRDLDNVRGFLSGSGPTALSDLPWMPLYLAICFLFHFWIGITALIGTVVLVALTLLTNRLLREPVNETISLNIARSGILELARRNAEAMHAMGLQGRLSGRWARINLDYLAANRRSGDVSNGLGSISKTVRIMLQSAVLGIGAYLVITGQATGGVMIASSIMMGRAFVPIDLAIANWKPFLMAIKSATRLKQLLEQVSERTPPMALPRPHKSLRIEGVTIIPPGSHTPVVSGVGFAVGAGSAVGVIGPSGSGKSTLSRVLVGAWIPAGGKVRLDDASIDQWDSEALGPHIGYLPQDVELFTGTVAENIARFEENPDPNAIVAAAQQAGVHELILRFEQGYETRIAEAGASLSAGQRQRIGLARALYRDPFLIVLDEPNANLDAEGEAAVVRAIALVRQRKGIVIVIAHRPSVIAAVDLVLMMDGGRQRAFGRRDEVLAKVLKDSAESAPIRPSSPVSGPPSASLRVVSLSRGEAEGDRVGAAGRLEGSDVGQ